MNKWIRRISIWAVFIIVDLIVSCACLELWVRLFVPVKNVQYILDDKIGVRFAPNQRTYGYIEDGYSNIFLTNSIGMHDVERNLEKAANSYRIQVYGNSIAAGLGVRIEETITSHLERFMNESGRPRRIEVMNMACGGDGTPSQILTYEEIGRRFSPDLVVCLFTDDFADNIVETHHRDWSPHYDFNEAGELRFIPPKALCLAALVEQLKWKSLFCRQISTRFFESNPYEDQVPARNRNLFFPSVVRWFEPDEYRKEICLQKALPVTLDLVKRFKYTVEKDGALFLVIDGFRFREKYVGTAFRNNDFEQFCRANSIVYIPAYQRIMELWNSPRFHFRDLHLNSEGNLQAAYFAAAQLMKKLPEIAPDRFAPPIRFRRN